MNADVLTVLITGSRDWTEPRPVEDALADTWRDSGALSLVVIHGGGRGVDTIAHRWAWAMHDFGLDVSVRVFPADWPRYGRAAGPIRNAVMVTARPDRCLAFPLGASRGTRDCIRQARLAGIPTDVHEGRST